MSVIGIVTNNGLSQSITSQSTNGWYIALSKFMVSNISLGSRLSLSTSRTRSTINSGTVFYISPISSKIAQSPQLLQVNCTVPPNQNGNVLTDVTEIYLFGESPQFDVPASNIRINTDMTAPNTIDLSATFVSMLVDSNTVIFKQNSGSSLSGSGLAYDDPTAVVPVNAVYYVKKVNSTRIELYADESLTTQVIFTGTGTGTHKICLEYLFAIGQPSVPIQYDPTGSVILRLLFNLQNIDVNTVFQFPYTQATEIYDHNLDPNAHPDLQDALNEGGLYVVGASPTFGYKGQSFIRGTSSQFHMSVTDKKPVYYDTVSSLYRLAQANGTSASNFIGFYFSSDNSIRVHGIVDVGHAFAINSDVYLSPTTAGLLTTTPSQVKVGRALSDGKLLVSALSAGTEVTGLNDLNDVTLTTPSNNQVMKYNGTQWVNVNPDVISSNTIVNIQQIEYQNTMLSNNYNNLYYDLLAQGNLVHVGTGSGYDALNRRYNVNAGDTLTTGNVLQTAIGSPYTEFRLATQVLTPANMTIEYSLNGTSGWTSINSNTDYVIPSFSTLYLRFTFNTSVNEFYSFGLMFDLSVSTPIALNIDDLNDVVISTPSNGDLLQFNGSNWINQPASTSNSMSYQGVWNATTNTPALVSSTGTENYYYRVSVSGSTTLDGISTWGVGDFVWFNGTAWQKIDNQSSVITTLDSLTDVTITTPSTGQVVQYVGGTWVNSDVGLDELSDVIITTPTTNQIIKYNGTNWVNDSDTGEANTASNIGTGSNVFKQKTGVDLEFRKLNSTTLTITQNTNDISIEAPGSGLTSLLFVGTSDYANASINESKVPTGVGTLNLSSNYLTTGKTFEFDWYFNYTESDPTNYNLEIKLGSTVIDTVLISQSVASENFHLKGSIVCRTTGVTGTVYPSFKLSRDSASDALELPSSSVTVDTTIALLLDFVFNFTSGNPLVFTTKQLIVKVMG